MRPAYFADTFYWAALASPNDSFYLRALTLSRSVRPERIVTSDDVLVEYLAFFAKAGQVVRSRAADLATQLLHNSRVIVIPQSRELLLAGLDLYRARPDKGYSLTDCISMRIMQRTGIDEVLSNDHHFEQEGFRVVFRQS